jgi:hypothetical protein
VRLEGLGQLKKSDDLIGNGTRDLSACSIVPSPTTLPHGPGVDSASNRNEYQESFWGKRRPAHKADNLTVICESIV